MCMSVCMYVHECASVFITYIVIKAVSSGSGKQNSGIPLTG